MKRRQERIYLETASDDEIMLHWGRYLFARKFVKGKRVLDIGCGSGYGTNFLAKYARKIIGIDYSEDAVNHCKNNYKKKNLSFLVVDARKLSFNNDVFDVIISFEVIEHFREQEKFLGEVGRVLKKGGIFIISTPNKKIFDLYGGGKPGVFHPKELSVSQLRIVLKRHFSRHQLFGQGWFTHNEGLMYKGYYGLDVPFKKESLVKRALRILIGGVISRRIYLSCTSLFRLRANLYRRYVSRRSPEKAICQIWVCQGKLDGGKTQWRS